MQGTSLYILVMILCSMFQMLLVNPLNLPSSPSPRPDTCLNLFPPSHSPLFLYLMLYHSPHIRSFPLPHLYSSCRYYLDKGNLYTEYILRNDELTLKRTNSNIFYLKRKSLKLAYINQEIKLIVQNFHTLERNPQAWVGFTSEFYKESNKQHIYMPFKK